MMYLVSWTLPSENRDAALARFQETGGRPPEGVKIHGRWHAVNQGMGLAVAEATDAAALGKWSLAWSDLLELEITPVVDDEGLIKILGG